MRKFFAGLAMTIMLRERSEIDFVASPLFSVESELG